LITDICPSFAHSLQSLVSLSIDERLKIAHNATASRMYDVLLDSPTVSATAKRRFVMDFIGYYHLLVDDRIGSRVGDRCWFFADTYLKVGTSYHKK
jgi:nucleolar protein 9